MSHSKYIFGILVIVIAAEVFLLLQQKEVTPIHDPATTLENIGLTEYWVDRILEVGGSKAYAEFREANNQFDINRQHNHAHIIGDAIFKALDLNGTAVCDSSYSFGCYHEYLGQAINAHGIDVVQELNEVCVQNLGAQALSCQHGIGHGVLSYFGYESDTLDASLDVCSNLPYSDPIGGCYGGIFMEYNMRTMLSLDGVGAREPLDVTNLHEPCDTLDADQKPACYYWQPQWWFATVRGTSEERFASMGDLCREVGDAAIERKCFEGIGNITPQSSGYDPEETILLCQSAATNSKQETYCRSDAANSFHAVPSVRDLAPRVCEGLVGEKKEFCIGHSINKFNQLEVAPSID